ncbi:molecular chaperone DjlA [Marinobacter sp. 2_MG-2023]|uniref:molecular chaperone DjlA n=1 Tax=Marinobacter sp. 2_MG-2023 TaxID=3062679 RepID=UPI0026E2D913|nr:molecular chaperone DjlA [Marinobacter sp. 2_MG-2023]MDO6441396.1 molecular chaperone DjlA [Marinobacter sp. 2_MG-2023]
MATRSAQPALPPRMEAAFSGLLHKLSASRHQAHKLIGETSLPRWCRRPLFFFLGYIARADGRVSEQDIRFAENLMAALRLSKRQRRKAIHSFQEGKASETLPPFSGLTLRLSHRIWPAPALKMAICLCHAAQLKGRPLKPRRYRCEDTIDQIGMPVSISEDIFDSYATQAWGDLSEAVSKPVTLEQACALLGVTRRDPVATIKRAYRKKVSECHPDKLAQQELTPAERALAKDRLLRYQQAWELIRRHH